VSTEGDRDDGVGRTVHSGRRAHLERGQRLARGTTTDRRNGLDPIVSGEGISELDEERRDPAGVALAGMEERPVEPAAEVHLGYSQRTSHGIHGTGRRPEDVERREPRGVRHRPVAPGRVVGIDRAEAPLADARAAATASGSANVSFAVGDAYALAFDDASFDVVHAHQVLQHLGDPITALVEMRRVRRPDGLVAVRDSDYAAMTWFPADPLLDRWLALYQGIARGNGGEPDAGRRLLSWGRAAGFGDIEASASTWCFATPDDRAWWGGLWADRVTDSAFATQAVERGASDPTELARISAAWRSWATQPDGWFAVVHGELLCRG